MATRRGWIVALLLALVTILLAGCGGGGVGDGPPEIRYGEDLCDECGMIISDERFAAGLVVELEPGVAEHRIFDDIGGMLLYAAEHEGELAISHTFVHDYTTREWLDGVAAFYVQSPSLQSPMGYGLAACRNRDEAVALAAEWGGSVLTYAELRAALAVESAPHGHP